MGTRNYHLDKQEIPEGLQIFEERLEVAGVSFRKENAIAFAAEKNGWLEFERDAGNKHDPNAIKIIGCYKDFLGIRRRLFVGYVPKEVSQSIVKCDYSDQIRPRLLKTYVSDSGFVEILFQVLGPKGKKYEFLQSCTPNGRHYSDFIFRVEQLAQANKYEDAISLLCSLVDATEKEAKKFRDGVTPWYYEKLAIIYRKQKRYEDEVSILERFEIQPKSPGRLPQKLAERLVRARRIRDEKGAEQFRKFHDNGCKTSQDVPTEFECESSVICKIATDKGECWEYRLACELLRDRMIRLDKMFDELDAGLAVRNTRCLPASETIDYANNLLRDLTKILHAAVKILQKQLVPAWGLPGHDGDAVKIKRACDNLNSLFLTLYEWELDVRFVRSHKVFNQLFMLMQGWAKELVEEFRRMVNELDQLSSKPGLTGHFTINLDFNPPSRIAEFSEKLDLMARDHRVQKVISEGKDIMVDTRE